MIKRIRGIKELYAELEGKTERTEIEAVLKSATIAILKTYMKKEGLICKGYSKWKKADFVEAIAVVSVWEMSKEQMPEPETVQVQHIATAQDFKKAFDENDNDRIYVRIPDIRRSLNWPRDVFDNMLRNLRDDGIICTYLADESTMTADEVKDCFFDENGDSIGTIIWNAGNYIPSKFDVVYEG